MTTKKYKIAYKDYMLFNEDNIERIDSCKDRQITFNERLPTVKGKSKEYGMTLKSFELLDFSFDKKADAINQTFKLQLNLDVSVVKKSEKEPQINNLNLTIIHKKEKSDLADIKQLGGVFEFVEKKMDDNLVGDATDTVFFEKRVIVLSYAIFEYLCGMPIKKGITYWEKVKKGLSPELGMMIYTSINQQIISSSFRDYKAHPINFLLKGAEMPKSEVGNVGDYFLDIKNTKLYGPKSIKGEWSEYQFDQGKTLKVNEGEPDENTDFKSFSYLDTLTNQLYKEKNKPLKLIPLISTKNTTADGLEESLSNMDLPKGNMTIHNVELNGAFRISYNKY